MRRAFLIGIAVLGLSPALTPAAEAAQSLLTTGDLTLDTTEDLYHICTLTPDDPLQPQAINLCQGFLLGVVSYHDAVVDRHHLKPLICYPKTATRDQSIEAFVAWGSSHQKDKKFMTEPALYGAVRGLAWKWPCK